MPHLNRLITLWHNCRDLAEKIMWLLAAEGMSRLSRLVTLFVLASAFSAHDYGLAMLALVIHELLRVFTRLGIGARIIQCPAHQLPVLIRSAASLQWLLAISLSLLQIGFAELIAQFYKQPLLVEILRIMALSHLIYPLVAIRVFLLHRDNNMRYYGLASGTCITFENLFIAVLVFYGADVFAVAWAKVFAALFWVALFCRARNPFGGYRWDQTVIGDLCRFGSKTLGSELIRALRFQLDSLFAGRLLGPELFGLYSFAKSAGFGVVQSLSQAYITVLYPHLCQQQRSGRLEAALRQTLRLTLCVATGFTLIAGLAPWYVEALFGDRWQGAETLCQILILAAIPALIFDQLVLQFRIQGHAGRELTCYGLSMLMMASLLLVWASPSPILIALLTLISMILSIAFVYLLRMANNKRVLKHLALSSKTRASIH